MLRYPSLDVGASISFLLTACGMARELIVSNTGGFADVKPTLYNMIL
jgi:hypothetical protein